MSIKMRLIIFTSKCIIPLPNIFNGIPTLLHYHVSIYKHEGDPGLLLE